MAAVGVAGYLILKPEPDVSNPDAAFVESDQRSAEVTTSNWPFYGMNRERTRYLRASGIKPPFRVAWKFNGRKLLEYSPILVGKQLYGINNNGEAFALKAKTGKVRWRREIAELNASSPAYGDGLLYYVNLEPGQIVALNHKNGLTRWKRELPGRTESSPVYVNGRVIVGCECGKLYAFDGETGKTIWETDMPGEVKAAPAVSQGVAYVGDYSGNFTAVRTNDGSVKWQVGVGGDVYSTAAVAFGRVYFGAKDGKIYSFEKDTGDLAWSQTIGGEVYAGIVAADTPKTPPSVYAGVFGDNSFVALDARSGRERWSADPGGSVIGAASLIGEAVYVANLDSTETLAFNAASGQKIWEWHDGAYNPVISNGHDLYLTGYKHIYRMRSGKAKAPKQAAQKKPGKKKRGKKK